MRRAIRTPAPAQPPAQQAPRRTSNMPNMPTGAMDFFRRLSNALPPNGPLIPTKTTPQPRVGSNNSVRPSKTSLNDREGPALPSQEQAEEVVVAGEESCPLCRLNPRDQDCRKLST